MVKQIRGFCIDCGAPTSGSSGGRCMKCHIKNLSLKQQKENHPSWKGGKSLCKMGYYRVWASKGRRTLEHRVIAEGALGRKLKSNEIVHHINGDTSDNRNKNLLICDKSYHNWLHWKMADLYMKEHFERQGIKFRRY